MRQAQKRKEKDKVAVVLMLCFCVIALTSIFTVKSNIDKIKDSNDAQNVTVSENTKTDEEPREEPQAQATETAEPDVQASQNVPTVDSLVGGQNESAGDFVYPVNSPDAQVSCPYSMDKLIYSVTLDQYMTHCGTDIKAPEDSQVLAVREGTVTAVYDDDRFGKSVEISHTGNLVSVYSNLTDGVTVEVGDVVEAGRVIGGVGSTGLFESLEPAHLHFEMLKDGAYVDPSEYIGF